LNKEFEKYYDILNFPVFIGKLKYVNGNYLITQQFFNNSFKKNIYHHLALTESISSPNINIEFTINDFNPANLNMDYTISEINLGKNFIANINLLIDDLFLIQFCNYDNIVNIQNILKHNNAVIYKTDASGLYNTTYISENVEKILGYNSKQFLDDPGFWDSIILAKYKPLVKQSLSNINITNYFEIKYQIIMPDGNFRWFIERAQLIRDFSGNPAEIVGYIVDYENQYELMKDLDRQNIELKATAENILKLNSELEDKSLQLNELLVQKDKFFSIIAHDLRTPLKGFMDLTNLFLTEFHRISAEEIKELTQAMSDSSGSIYTLLENLLSWSKIQTGKMVNNPIVLELSSVIMMNVDLYLNNAKQKNIRLFNNVPRNIFVFSDVNLLNAIIRNLISNALKFTVSGGIIEISAKTSDGFCIIEVKDNGVGMNADVLSKLFKIDTYITHKGTNNEEGSGLGLILCKENAEMNGGTIWVQSKLDEGSIFYLTVPLNKDN
jgi:signal transduction histidine kinase